MNRFELLPTTSIHSLADLECWPGFRQDVCLNDAVIATADAIQNYRIGPEPIPCGLASCHTWHNRGFLVHLDDGTHTNVGRDCGRNHFGVEHFDSQVKALEAEQRERDLKVRVNEFLDQIPERRARTLELWHQSAWLNDAVDNFKAVYERPIVVDLRTRARRGQDEVTATRQLSDTELAAENRRTADDHDDELSGGQRPKYITETIGHLRGIRILIIKPREVLQIVLDQLDKVEAADKAEVTKKKLAAFAKVPALVEQKLDEAKALMAEGHAFFMQANFELLPYLLEGDYAQQCERVLWDFATQTGRKLSEGQLKRWRRKKAS